MLFVLLWACSPKQKTTEPTATTVTPETIQAVTTDSKTEEYVLAETPQFDSKHRKDWPFSEWTTAKAYAYNMTNFGPGASLFVYREGEWNPSITEEKTLDSSQAQAALELNHRLGGKVSVSKCAFPRHAIVFFDAQEQPVGSINVCFECGDILVWPDYYGEEDDTSFRYAMSEVSEMPTIFDHHEQTLPVWEDLLITTIGLKAYTRK